MNEAIKMAIEALEDACGNRCNAEYNPCHYREAIDALRAQPDHSELVKELRSTIGLDRLDDDDNVALVPRWIVEQAANALEGKL